LNDKEILFPFINSNAPNRLRRIERLEGLLAKMEIKRESLETEELLDNGKYAK